MALVSLRRPKYRSSLCQFARPQVMQHLPFLPQKKVPWLGGPRYKGEGLSVFLNRHGWAKESLRLAELADQSSGSAIAFVQSLLNVAILVDLFGIFGIRVDHDLFCRNRTDGAVIDTSALPVLITLIARIAASMADYVKKASADKIGSLLEFARSCKPYGLSRDKEAVTLGIAVLLQSLSKLLPYAGVIHYIPQIYDKFNVGCAIVDILYQDQWCPRQILKLSYADIIGVYYVTTLKKNPTTHIHRTCTSSKCIANQIESQSYKTRHVNSCKGCDHIVVDQTRILDCINRDIVPQVYISPESQGSTHALPKLHVTGTGPYSAISHVWAQRRMFPWCDQECLLANNYNSWKPSYEQSTHLPVETSASSLKKKYWKRVCR